MRYRILLSMTILLTVSAFAGCAKTPEESLVKMKGKNTETNYEEVSEEDSQDGTGIREQTGAPETYQSDMTDETGNLRVLTDAKVEIPDALKASVISVTQPSFSQEMIDKITETFFPGGKVYSSESYFARTKDVVLEELTRYKGYVAEGNLDPKNLGTDENGNYIFDIYGEIERLEAEYENAPETRTLEEIKPAFDIDPVLPDYFDGIAETAEGEQYMYTIQRTDALPVDAYISRVNKDITWFDYGSLPVDSAPALEEIQAKETRTLDEADALAREKIEQLGLENMSLGGWDYTASSMQNPYLSNGKPVEISDAGYLLHYTRNLNGIPITYEREPGGQVDGDGEPWGYESVEFQIGPAGIETVRLRNLYEIGETKTEQVKLKSFDEIMKIYEKMMLIQNAFVMDGNSEKSRTYTIDRIVFGYSRISEPSGNGKEGILVPVWDFFGSCEGEYSDAAVAEGRDSAFHENKKYQSYFTVNAIDGSVIYRPIGY